MLPSASGSNWRFYELGQKHRAWTLLTDKNGVAFPDFDAFCACPPPYGLGTDPTKFRAHMEAELGKKTADLATVAPGSQGERTDLNETSPHDEGKSIAHAKQERLRAILRAPEIVQHLYREGLVSQTVAASMGPAKPSEEKAGAVVRARKAIEAIPPPLTPKHKPAYRKQVDATIRETLSRPKPGPLDELRKAWAKASSADRATFLAEIGKEQS